MKSECQWEEWCCGYLPRLSLKKSLTTGWTNPIHLVVSLRMPKLACNDRIDFRYITDLEWSVPLASRSVLGVCEGVSEFWEVVCLQCKAVVCVVEIQEVVRYCYSIVIYMFWNTNFKKFISELSSYLKKWILSRTYVTAARLLIVHC